MATRCPECAQKFTAHTALCEDWRDPEKSFGCPHCGTFFVKDMNPGKREQWLPTVFLVGMVVPAANLAFRYFYEGAPSWVLFYSVVILISATAICIGSASTLLRPLEKSPWQGSRRSAAPTTRAGSRSSV